MLFIRGKGGGKKEKNSEGPNDVHTASRIHSSKLMSYIKKGTLALEFIVITRLI